MHTQKMKKLLIFLSVVAYAYTQPCQVAKYLEQKENASAELIGELHSFAVPIEGKSLANLSSLYFAVASSSNIAVSEDGKERFAEAISTISDGYFKACYSLEDERPTIRDAPLHSFLSLLANRTDFGEMRELFGKLSCLNSFKNNTIEKREVNLLECANAASIKELYDCLDENDTLSCVFDIYHAEDEHCEVVDTDEEDEHIEYLTDCLAFAIDTTGSMSEEIAAAKEIITNFVQSEENIRTLCYILVPFNDFDEPLATENLEYWRLYDANSISNNNNFDVYDYNNEKQIVYGTARLLQDINNLTATGGGDCPEYGMTAILKAIELLRGVTESKEKAKQGKHNIIVLTDASAKNDSLYTLVVQNATNSELNVRIHFLFSGSGCYNQYGHYPNISAATGGIIGDNIDSNAFSEFVSHLSLKRSIPSQCQFFTVSAFVTNFSALIVTSQTHITLTKPNEVVETINSAGGGFVIHKESNPLPGEWKACVLYDTIDVTVKTVASIDVDIEHVIEGNEGQLLPTQHLPLSCYQNTFLLTASKDVLAKISLNETVYLDIVNGEGEILESSKLDACKGIFSTSVVLPYSPILQYQLSGYDIYGNQFSHWLSDRFAQYEVPYIHVSLIGSSIIVNPGDKSLVQLSLVNPKKGPHILAASLYIELPGELFNIEQLSSTSLLIKPQRELGVEFYLYGNLSLALEKVYTLGVAVNDNCTSGSYTTARFQIIVKQWIHLNLTDASPYTLMFEWTKPAFSGNVTSYRLVFDLANKTFLTIDLNGSVSTYCLQQLAPFQLVYASIEATADSGESAAIAPIPFRTAESEPSEVLVLKAIPLSQTSVNINWLEPQNLNGLLLLYEVILDDKFFAVNETSLTVYDLNPFVLYKVLVQAVNSAGRGRNESILFYTIEGVPLKPPQDVKYIFPSSTSILLSWNPPLQEDQQGFIIKYSIILIEYKNMIPIDEKLILIPGNQTRTEVSGLSQYSNLSVILSAQIIAGRGPNVTFKNVLIVTGIPSAPRNFTGELAVNRSIVFQWMNPTEPNGLILRFHLFHLRSNFAEEVMLLSVSTNLTINHFFEYRSDVLKSSEEHFFIIAAENNAGLGENSTIVTVKINNSNSNNLQTIVPVTISALLATLLIISAVFFISVTVIRRKCHRAHEVKKSNT